MNMEKFLHFFIKHNALLIEAMIALILIASGFLAYRSFRNSRDEETGGPVPDMSNLEDALKKIIEKANQIPTQTIATTAAVSVSTQGAKGSGSAQVGSSEAQSSAEAASLANEITKLKLELEKKQAEIEAMKKSGTGAMASDGGLSSDEKATLNTQINELKRKLEEYDIISADIADLSFYKEENARLQKELAAKGSGSASAPAQTAKPAPATTPAAAAPPPPQTVVQAPAAEQPVTTTVSGASPVPQSEVTTVTSASPPSTEAPIVVTGGGQIPPTESPEHAVENVVDDDIMKDFAAAVADQGGTDLSEIEIPQIDPITAESIEGTKQTVPAESSAMPNIDIPAIGEEKAQVKPSEGDGANPLGSLDLDKMASEVVALPDATQVDGQVDSLSGAMDPEKLAQEASTLTASGVKPEDKELMGKFENFVKKEKT